MASLRSKLEEDPGEPRHLLTVHGVGYKFVAESGSGTSVDPGREQAEGGRKTSPAS
jgi:DNA-binding winged helix-turn-helix (wHTH) protein